MLQHTEQEWLQQIFWSTRRDEPIWRDIGDYIMAFECWKYEHIHDSRQGHNWRMQWLAHEPAADGPRSSELDERVLKWLRSQDAYEALPPPANAGAVQGGIRLILCDRPNMLPGITMSETAFKTINTAFSLHPMTLPSFFPHGGVYTSIAQQDSHSGEPTQLHIVVKAAQKVEIANYLLSLTYNVQTGWTNAIICGDGVVKFRSCDTVYGEQLEQLINAVVLNPQLWTNPLLLPFVILDNNSYRTQRRVAQTEADLIEVERTLGVMNAGPVWQEAERSNWPRDIDTKEITIKLHSVAPQIVFMKGNCTWLRNYAAFLKGLNGQLAAEAVFARHGSSIQDLQGKIDFAISWTAGMDTSFTILQDRTKLQVDVLYNVISQQANVLNQQETRLNTTIARSAKQDSISMTTFTFITALFLPASVIASLLGMSMFDWSPSGKPGSDRIVSSKFWLFWAITVPLTLATLAGWLLWFKHANKKFDQEMERFHLENNTRKASVYPQTHLGWVRSSLNTAGIADSLPLKPTPASQRRSRAQV